jgi:Mrp family chromosome partitioning ATPase
MFSEAAGAPRRPSESRNNGPRLTDIVYFVRRVFVDSRRGVPRVAVFCGLKRNANSSSICAAVTKVLAEETQGSVCAVDANVLAPSLHQYFASDNRTGLTDALLLSQPPGAFAKQIPSASHWFVANGRKKLKRQSLATMPGLSLRIRELRSQFEFVLIDAPPLRTGHDALALGTRSDGVILVADSSETYASEVRDARQQLGAVGVGLLGVVMTQQSKGLSNLINRLFL